MSQLAERIYQILKEEDEVSDIGGKIGDHSITNEELGGALRSLQLQELLTFKEIKEIQQVLTDEGKDLRDKGSYEWRIVELLKKNNDAISRVEMNDALGNDEVKHGFPMGMKNGWIMLTEGMVRLKSYPERDEIRDMLISIERGTRLPESHVVMLKRRKLIEGKTIYRYQVRRGPRYSDGLAKKQAELTQEHLRDDEWKNIAYKEYNLNSQGKMEIKGTLHPLMKVREEFKNIFIEMGFKEMETSRFIESSFWNFDALFQPQKHSARDAHDTFFMKVPSTTIDLPSDYVEKVKVVHSVGNYGSTGYQSEWLEEEARKNILRTHTTAISAKLLYAMSMNETKPKPGKYFSIDRVFRNEAIDATHLAEFHQIEGVVLDYGLGIQHLMGIIDVFFRKMGLTKLKYKPTYNPYTEPSLEIFCYHDGLRKWIEIGNSGLFRPEMLRAMGLPEDMCVAGWGLSLERPTMIRYGISNIRDVMGHRMNLDLVESSGMCMLGYD